jgi:topoisomerase IA-like protein
MEQSIPKATNIKAENAEGTQFSAEINGTRWSGIQEGSTDWKSIMVEVEKGNYQEYVEHVDTPAELLAKTDIELLKMSARTLEDILDERIDSGKFVAQPIKDKIAERKALRGQL